MAVATLVALVHDVLITVGVYSVIGFEVTPATVIAVLTILGYSIYDGIVVFDKVDENTRLVSSTGGLTYGGMVNLSLNQVLMRSLNTTITALLPVLSLLVVGSCILGAVDARGVRPRPARRPVLRRLLVDLHRLAAAGRAQGARAPLPRHQAAHRRPEAATRPRSPPRWPPGGRRRLGPRRRRRRARCPSGQTARTGDGRPGVAAGRVIPPRPAEEAPRGAAEPGRWPRRGRPVTFRP